MKKCITVLLILFLGLKINAQSPIKFRVDKQAMSSPMTPTDEIFFGSSYNIKPVNVNFDGEILIITYDNGSIFKQMNLSLVNQKDFSDYERYFYIDPKMPSDTIIYESGYMIGYVKIILPTKRESDDYYGYTSYTDYNIKYKKDPNYLTQN